ncbi:fimbrial biogenesis chaperone [Anabaena azotica]|uniref:Fimbria/pilus periplasmic chaperone n=1 Tax=Anabaena azotica FACHB-119 TaxID=947527 RepID=A0ABR8D1E0_9NOST|nr:fimbria/pilus periplasmic chaperone [Anabaena azotica]MBD2500233.1 fimbria/pilus periplasmic chaperone [Anabaena azotica FACHB-119]
MQSFLKFNNIALGLLGALVLGMPAAQALNIGVSPSRIEIKVNNQGRSQSIRVVNYSSETAEFKTTVNSWVMNDKNKLQEVAGDAQSLAQWIVFTPSQFKVPPGGSQTVRFSVRPKVQPSPGEHRAIISFEEVSPTPQAAKGSVRVVGKVGVVVYASVGEIKRIGTLNSVNVDTKPNAVNAAFDISNQGNGHVRLTGQYAVWPAAKYPGAEATKPIANLGKPDTKITEPVADIGFLPSTPVMPSDRRKILLEITKKLAPGNYVLDINGELNGVKIDKGIPFTVTNAPVDNNRNQNRSDSQKPRNSIRNLPRR